MDIDIDLHDPHQLDSLTAAELDRLPYGATRVDSDGVILFYSRRETEMSERKSTAVLGRNFFTDVAPCTMVPEFYGRFRRGVLTGNLDTRFEFSFDCDMHPVQVRISMRASERAGEFWIIIEPLRILPRRADRRPAELIENKFPKNTDAATDLSSASFDFSRRDQEPIAFCDAVQPFGCLLVLQTDTLEVLACSANSAQYLGREPDAVLGRSIVDLLPSCAEQLIASLGAINTQPLRYARFFRLPATTPLVDLDLHIRLHLWRDRLLLEMEPDCPPQAELAMDTRLLGFDFNALQSRLQKLTDIPSICQEAIDALRYLSGFQRVLAYRLEPDDAGLVIAESLADGTWPRVLGLRYPATDIPRQAHALCIETPLRYAPSRDHSDVALLTRSVLPGANLESDLHPQPEAIDIGIAHLRAQSPIHRAYLERFNVNGSMSLSILNEGRLWGLLIFHHRVPHPVTPTMRQRLIEFAGFLSARLALLEEQSSRRARDAGVTAVNHMVGSIDLKQPFPLGFHGKASLLRKLVNADAVQIFHHDKPLFAGGTFELSGSEIKALLGFLRLQSGPIWSTDCLSGEFEPAAAYPRRLAGVMAVFVGADNTDLLLFGRRRTRYQVRWGADPVPLPFFRPENERSCGWPSRDFQAWNEERTHHAKPWSDVEVATGIALRALTQQVIVTTAAHFENLALHDSLTGLPNREYFRQLLLESVQACAGEQHSGDQNGNRGGDQNGSQDNGGMQDREQESCDGPIFGVGLLDIDHFKSINDTLGHDIGDRLLQIVAERLVTALPPEATAARLGGDEFALLLPPCYEDVLDGMPEQIITALREPVIIGHDRFSVTSSMGLSLGHARSEPSELLKQADLALYQAKEAGRNCVRGFDSSLQQRARIELETNWELLAGDTQSCVELWLQPQVPIRASSGARRFEVLTRWRTADGRLIMPTDYIAAAERNGMIRAVTASVLRQAILLLREQLLADNKGVEIVLAVNVSAADLDDICFARRLLEDLHAADVPPDSLELEITESMLLQVTPALKNSLGLISRGGVSLSLDDFGSGFSSMAYLRELPISCVKIDRNFIGGIAEVHDRRLVGGIIALAHSLDKQVVAEGIERIDQLGLLREFGCDWGQGYLWSKPLLPEQALALDLSRACQN